MLLNNSPNLTLNSPINDSVLGNYSATLNITVSDVLSNITKFIIYGSNSTGNSTWGIDYNNVLFINNSIQNGSSFNLTYNFTSLPIKPQPDGSDGLVLLYHFDNLSGEQYQNSSNATVLDFSTAGNNGTNVVNSSTGGPQYNQSGM